MFVLSLMNTQTAATLSLCAGKPNKRVKTSDIVVTVKTSNKKKEKQKNSDEDYVDGNTNTGRKDITSKGGTKLITKYFSPAASTKTGVNKTGGTSGDKNSSTAQNDFKKGK